MIKLPKAKCAVIGYLFAVVIMPALVVAVPLFKVVYWPTFETTFTAVSAVKLLSVALLAIKVMRYERFKDFLER